MSSTIEYDRDERTEQKRPFSDRTASAPSSTSDREKLPEAKPDTSTDEELQKAPWRALFFFTTQSNVPILMVGIFSSIVAGAVPAFNAYIQGKVFKSFIDLAAGTITGQEVYDDDKKYVLYFMALGGASWVAHSVEFTAWLSFGELQAKRARDRLFHGLLEREIEWYDMRKNGIGALLPRLQTQIRELQLATSQPLGLMAQAVSTLVLSLAEAFYFGWDLTLVTMSTVPVIMGAVLWISTGTQGAIDAQQAKLIEAQKYTNSAFSSIETVKCFNGQDIEREKYTKKLAEAGSKHHSIANMAGLMMGCMVFLGSTIFVQGFYYGGVLIEKEKKTTADVMTCFLSAIAAFSAIQAAMPQILVLEKGRAAGASLRKIMAEAAGGSSAQHSTALTRPPTCHGNIDVRNVSFAYPSRPGQLALDNVTLSIPGGAMTFLIGKSGSGKSTLSQLLLRFYSFSEGSITVDGVPLSLLDLAWLRTNFTLVEQTSLLFNDTVFQNIAFGRHDHENVTRGEVMEAVEFALLQLMISDMPKGLDTLVGHKGGAMSGGQRQRMALARARLRDSPILMLDESTSALDHISRALMMDAVRQWRRGKTTIIITHDISQILSDDYAYVLDQGRLVQEGFRKHMEKMKDTPFQSFLTPEDRATVSPDARKPTNLESINTRGSSLEDASTYSFSDDGGRTPDPLEVQSRAGETKRTSFIPPAFTEGGYAAGMRGPAMQGATSAFASPLLRMTVSPQTLPAILTKWAPGSSPSTPTSEIGSPADSPVDNRNTFWMTTMLESLVDRSGKQAADARAVPESIAHRVRRPVHDETWAKLTGNASSQTPEDEGSLPADHVRQRSLKHLMYTLWPSLDGFSRTLLVIGFICGVIHAVASPLFSYIFSKLLSTYSVPQGHAHKKLVYSMTMLGIAAADGISTYFFRYLLECVGQRWVDSLRGEAIKRILDQPREFFDQELNTVGRLTEDLDRNAEVMRDLLGRFTGMIFVAALISLISIAWALSAQWKFTLICLTAAPYIFLVTNAFSAVSARWETISTDASEAAGTIFVETFTNIKTVRALTLERHFVENYTVATNYALRVGFMRALFSGFFFGMSDSAATFSTALIFYVGSLLARDGGPKSTAALLQVTAILVFAITNVSAILAFVPQINGAKDSGSRLLRLAQLPERSHEHLGDTRIVAVGDIQFTELNFAYPSRPEFRTLRDINLRIKPGIPTAIVGGSGSGKSTIANLLLNLYSTVTTPSTKAGKLGDLTLAGRDINQIHTPSLRALVVVVPQMPTVFAATVAENIAYGLAEDSPYNNLASITKAAQSAGIHDFIATLPSAYNTTIGDGGIGLSGGQAQRVAIARALVRNPSVLILDEATSALDVESASLVRDTIKSLLDNKSRSMTVIIITHSREQMEIADHIVVLDHGIIVEEGGFYELLQKDGPLKNLLSGGEWDARREEAGAKRKARPRGGSMMGDVNWKRRSRAPRRLRM